MAETLVEFDAVIPSKDGRRWVPRACGRIADDGLWEGWLEFVPEAGGSDAPVRTRRETEQPNRDDLMYWAEGLSVAYLEEALKRALEPRVPPVERSIAPPHFDGPASRAFAGGGQPAPRAVLNPFEVYHQGQDILVQELSALDAGRLRDIAVDYGFADAASVDGASREALSAIIIAGVRRPLGASRDDARPESGA